jgi:probable HAF family extracellular repeat protein
MRDLGALAGGKTSSATAINDRGQVLGQSDTKFRDARDGVVSHAFVWQSGKMQDRRRQQ